MNKLLLVFAFLSTHTAFANFTVFQTGRAPIQVKEDFALTESSLKGRDLNRGTAAQEILRFIERHKNFFGLAQVDGESLVLAKAHANEPGFSLRFKQRHNRVHIEGAEVVAIFDWSGELRAINSSLVTTPSIHVNPEISKKDAFRAAAAAIGYADPELGDDDRDGLVLLVREGAERLVWQFSMREHETGAKPRQIQVIASGSRKGDIHRVINIAHEVDTVNIYDATVTIVTPSPIFKGVHVLKNGKPTLAGRILVSDSAKNADKNFGRVQEFYKMAHGRRGYDNAGADVNASVNVQKVQILDVLGMRQNAAWVGPWKMFVFGAGGDLLGDFASALDVVGHEYTHAVIDTTSRLQYIGESGALNEHLADLFGVMIENRYESPANPFLIGDKVVRGELKKKAEALRDMLHPEKGASKQPGTMSEIPPQFKSCSPGAGNDNCGVHTLSGIPNRAAALIAERLGFDKIRALFYRVMTARLRSSSDFKNYRDQVVDECNATLASGECDAVKSAFGEVGL